MHSFTFTESKTVTACPDKYLKISVDTAKVLNSWRQALYSFEWLDEEGNIKEPPALDEKNRAKYEAVSASIKNGEAIERPVLGIGLLENIEIGSGKVVFLVLSAMGVSTIDVHIPKSCESDFKDFRTDL